MGKVTNDPNAKQAFKKMETLKKLFKNIPYYKMFQILDNNNAIVVIEKYTPDVNNILSNLFL